MTKLYGNHNFKGGFELQQIKFPWIALPNSRGYFGFSGLYTSIPNQTDGSTGRAQFLLAPSGAGMVGGSDSVAASNFGGVAAKRSYYGGYIQDDWKVSQKFTLNLGLRWDWFSPTGETYGAQANLIPGTPFQNAAYIIPTRRKNDPLSASFLSLLQQDGIKLLYSDDYGGSGLSKVQKSNFAPRIGFAYRLTPKLVARGGYGFFYGAFENRGGYPSLGYNYPFQYSFSFPALNPLTPVTFPNGSIATIENGLSAVPLNPSAVNASGLALRGIQAQYKTPYVESINFTLGYQLTQADTLDVGYVASLSRHLETNIGSNYESVLLPPGYTPQNYIPFPGFSRGGPYADTIVTANYHSLQVKYQRRITSGLNMLVSYTFSKTRTDAG